MRILDSSEDATGEISTHPVVNEDCTPEEIGILPGEMHLLGLRKLLGESLYSTLHAALREFIQITHDSCVRRRENMAFRSEL